MLATAWGVLAIAGWLMIIVKAATLVPASTLLNVSKREKFIFMAIAN
jgi:hypothetical protein